MRRFLSAVELRTTALWLAPGRRARTAAASRVAGHDQQRQPRVHERAEGRAFHRQRRDEPRRHDDLRRRRRRVRRHRTTRVATGNVVFAQGNNRISAERAEFNTETASRHVLQRLGDRQRPAAAPARARRRCRAAARSPARKPNVYFFGEKIEKIGPRKYKITNGGFSTCVQPTPRWDLHADTVILNVDHYTLLKQAVFTREGRADVLLADLLLPDQAGESRDRLSASRPTASRPSAARSLSQRVLLGDRSQPGRHVLPRLVLEGRPGRRQRVPLQLRAPAMATSRPTCSTSTRATMPSSSGPAVQCPRRAATRSAASANQLLPRNFRARATRRLLLQHPDDADVQHEHLRRLAQPALVSAATSSARGAPTR